MYNGNGAVEYDRALTNMEDDEDEGGEEVANSKTTNKESTGRWTNTEHQLFLRGLELYGKGWKKIACLIKTRAVVQIRTHAQKYFLKLSKARQNGGNAGESLGGLAMDLSSRKRKRRGFGKQVSISRPLAPFVRLANYCNNKDMPSGAGCDTSIGDTGVGAAMGPGAGGAVGVPLQKESIDVNESLYNFLSPVLQDPSNKGGQWYRQGGHVDILLQEAATLNWLEDNQIGSYNVSSLGPMFSQQDMAINQMMGTYLSQKMTNQGLLPVGPSVTGMNGAPNYSNILPIFPDSAGIFNTHKPQQPYAMVKTEPIFVYPRSNGTASVGMGAYPSAKSAAMTYESNGMNYINDIVTYNGDNRDINGGASFAGDYTDTDSGPSKGQGGGGGGEERHRRLSGDSTANSSIATGDPLDFSRAKTSQINSNMNIKIHSTNSFQTGAQMQSYAQPHPFPPRLPLPLALDTNPMVPDAMGQPYHMNYLTSFTQDNQLSMPRSSSQRSLASLGLARVRSVDDCTVASNLSGWDLENYLDGDDWCD